MIIERNTRFNVFLMLLNVTENIERQLFIKFQYIFVSETQYCLVTFA